MRLTPKDLAFVFDKGRQTGATIFFGTVISVSAAAVSVLIDGDDDPVNAIRACDPVASNRVVCLLTPTHRLVAVSVIRGV
jgi:hypothetical protein